MARWTFAVGPWSAGPRRELTAAKGRKITFRRRGGATIAFSIDGRHDEATELEELVTDVHVWRDGTKLFRGRVGPTEDTIDEEKHAVSISVGDYRNVLDRRLLLEGDPELAVTWSTDVGALVETLLDLTQGRPYGDLGITTGAGFPAGRNAPNVQFSAGQSITKAIDCFADTDPATTGFDWEIDADLVVNLYPGGRGAARGVLLDYGGAVAKVKRTVDPTRYTNAGRWSGWPGEWRTEDDPASANPDDTIQVFYPGPDPLVLTAGDLSLRPEGRWEEQRNYPEARTDAMLAELAARDLAELQTLRPAYAVTLAPGRWLGPGHVWLGDTVTLRVGSGRLDVLSDLRVEELAVGLSEDETETVDLVLGSEFPGFEKRLGALERRLRDLERA